MWKYLPQKGKVRENNTSLVAFVIFRPFPFFSKYFRILTHYQTTNFRLFQTERVCRRQLKLDENGRKLSKWVENTVGKGEIA